MATITTNVFLDDAARTAGEAMTINSGGQLTVRTDYRVHANAPASNTGALGSVTINEGKFIWDSSAVRWLEFNNGTGNVPSVGTVITKGAVSGYLLGVWASKTVAQTAVGSSMPTTGFIKFREVSGGTFTTGTLTNIGADAVGSDVQGWISLPHDSTSNFTIPRLGEHRARGGRFFLEKTNGTVGQVFQIPNDGSTAVFAPGMWVETGENTDVYEYWPSLNGASLGWTLPNLGEAKGYSDKRQKFVKSLAGGSMVMGEDVVQSSTYGTMAAQAATHAEISHSCTYVWENDKVIVYFASGHLLETGQQTGLDFTSGGATAYDGIYEVTVLSPYHFSVNISGSGASGNVTSKPGLTISYSAHGLNVGERVYCDFTSGTPVDGTYEIYAVTSVNGYLIKYPHVAALTSGNVSCLHTLNITFTSNGLPIGSKVYCDFTSGTGVSGLYTVKFIVDANVYRIACPVSAVTSGNVTVRMQIGFVAPANCRTWIGSNIVHETTTTTRATNNAPHATIGSRPEWITTSAGAIDLEYIYGCSCYASFSQPYSIRLQECSFFDTLIISECATPLNVKASVSLQLSANTPSLSLTSNFAGGTVEGNFQRFNLSTNGHSAFIQYCKDLVLNNVISGIIGFARSTGYAFQLTTCNNITLNNCRCLNGNVVLTSCNTITINDLDYCDRYRGRTNVTTQLYAFLISAGNVNIKIDGLTFGLSGTVEDCHPSSGIASTTASTNVDIRNIGSRTSLLSGGIWAPNVYSMGYINAAGGNNNNVKFKRIYIDKLRVAPYTTVNSDKNMTYESIFGGFYAWGTKALLAIAHADLNGFVKGCEEINTPSGQSSVYGTHFIDTFAGIGYGRITLAFNEPTAETSDVFTMNSGTAKFNSAGGLMMNTVGMQATFADQFFRKGHSGFAKTEAILTGPTQTRFDIHYAIDNGSGFGSFHNLYYTRASVSGTSGAYTFTLSDSTGVEVGDYIWGTGRGNIGRVTEINGNVITSDVANSTTVSGTLRFNHIPYETPNVAGFRLKFRLTVITTETVACLYLRIETVSSLTAQTDNLYPLDTNKLTISGVLSGSDVIVYSAGTSIVKQNTQEISGTTNEYSYETPELVDIGVFKPGYIPFYIRNYNLPLSDSNVLVTQMVDRAYIY